MRAVVIKDVASRDTVRIETVADPAPAAHEVVVDVMACGINYTDYLSLDGKYQNNPPPPFTPGRDAAGIVGAVGDAVTRHRIGDRVIAHVVHGAMAEKVACHEDLVFAIPDEIGFEQAAATGFVYQTAYCALITRGAMKPGETVLVNGAAGGVGLAAVALAKGLGASQVIGGLATLSKSPAVRKAGADAIVNLSSANLKDTLREEVFALTEGRGVDMVIDLVGGEAFDAALRTVADEGRIVVTGFASGAIPTVRVNYLLLKNISVVGMTLHTYLKSRSPRIGEAQALIFDLLRQGRIDANIMDIFPFERFLDGIRLLEERKIVGKAVLRIRPD